MATKKERWWNNNWVVTIGGGIALFLIIDVFIKQNLLSMVWNWFSALITTKYNLPLWWLVLLVISSIGLTILAFWMYARLTNDESKNERKHPEWTKFREMRYKAVLVKWNWMPLIGGSYQLDYIRYCCPDDGCELNVNTCPVCEKVYYTGDISMSALQKLISHKTEEYRKK